MLTSKQRKTLKSLSHPLKPIVSVGKKGFSEALLKEISSALLAHELIKVQFQESAVEELQGTCDQICAGLACELVEIRGHIASFYKGHPEKPRIDIQ